MREPLDLWKSAALAAFRHSIDGYHPIDSSTWEALKGACRFLELRTQEHFVAAGESPHSFAFLHCGLIRAYAFTSEGKEYNKIFFTEGMMPAAIVALLEKKPSDVALQALENCRLIEIDHGQYRRLLASHPDLLMYHCRYLERNWVITKEPREVALAQQDASERYETFLHESPGLEQRLSQAHIAAHLGVTPTQLSRIRRARRARR